MIYLDERITSVTDYECNGFITVSRANIISPIKVASVDNRATRRHIRSPRQLSQIKYTAIHYYPEIPESDVFQPFIQGYLIALPIHTILIEDRRWQRD